MLPNEIFALACRAYYDEEGLIVDSSNGQFAHCPYPEGMGDSGYYLLHNHHQQQGLLQSKDVGQCCFYNGHALKWLRECDYFPENYFELWDIYEEWAGENARKTHAEKDEFGRSLHALKPHVEKDDLGRSVNAVKAARASHFKKDESGRSVNAIKAGKASAEATPIEMKRERGRKGAEILNAILSSEQKREFGRRGAEAAAEIVTLEQRKSWGHEGGKASALALTIEQKKAKGKKFGDIVSSQIWESIIDGFRGNAGNVVRHNKAKGWDPAARIRIS